ncbi:A-kinase anchor protein 14 [Atta colombica]|uniref:A-kinase anchor protein 14 n=1 Tax=Atta colombica TaxID=520822 RepID=A0A195AU99_9HYME|nr:PREDICTED: A-kinase anchor protein 14-like [Atta colombica]KYM75751.1 A-kinase anchor protein 14 [Atta colombica]
MIIRKRRSVYNTRPAKDQQVEFYQDVTHFVRRFVNSAVISAMKIVAVMALKNWMFRVKFICLNKENTTEFYMYHVLWSIPTPAYPEPYVTVSVFFCIAASRVQPPYFPVDVTYVFEGHQFVHRLDIVFQPKWLYDILDMKTMLSKTFTF